MTARFIARLRLVLLSLAISVALMACQTTEPVVQKIDAQPLQPTAGEQVTVDDLLVIIDSSGSLDEGALFYEERALIESFLASTPDGDYETGAVAFGGFDRHEVPLARYDRERLQSEAAKIPYLKSGTPVHKVLEESQQTLSGHSGRAAIVIFSDGEFTDEFGREVEVERIVTAASELDRSYDGEVCFHTVQVGESEVGAEMLRRISSVTSCGTSRRATSTQRAAQLYAMQRDVFIEAVPVAAAGAALPSVSAPAPSSSPAEGTSWSVNFELESATVDPRYRGQLDEISTALQANPNARVRISGHTDASGNAEYNRQLSMRRAQATREALIEAGVDVQRIDVQGLGEGELRFEETTVTGRAANRRTEIELIE